MEPIILLRWRGAWPNVDEYRRKVEEPTSEQRRLWGCDEYAALPRAEYDALIAQRDGATARADAADERAKAAEALLTTAYDLVAEAIGTMQYDFRTRAKACVDAARKLLLDANAPTPDDRKGVDGDAIQAQGGGRG